MEPNSVLMHGVVSGVQLVMILILVIDIVVTSMKWGQEKRIWNAVENGEMSYINLVNSMMQVHGVRETSDHRRKDKVASSIGGHPRL